MPPLPPNFRPARLGDLGLFSFENLFLPSAVCRLPSAVCRLPSAVCRLPSAVCRLPSAVCRLPIFTIFACMEARFIYITCKDTSQAQTIGKALVENRLAACANILPGMQSIYSWKGEIVEDEEVVLIAKSTADRVDALTEKVKELHSYEVPCVVAMEIKEGNPEYLRWIEEAVDR